MHLRRTRVLVALLVVSLLSAGALMAGCKKGEQSLVSYWPKADKERIVPKPAEPPRWPLTGLDAPSAEATKMRLVSVKIENSPEARPQTNMQMADVVYESVTEGGITRFNAIFQSQSPDTIGPVRSARLSDLYIVPEYNALFVFSGASSTVNARLNKAGIDNLSEDAGISYPFSRSSSRPRPHNLYLSLAKLREESVKRKMDQTQSLVGFTFERVSSEPTSAIMSVSIPFSTANKVEWTYDAASKTYLRVNSGKKFMDAATNKQISARNVVVLWAQHKSASQDKVGSTTYEIILSGSGQCSIFRDGQRFDGTWTTDGTKPPSFKSQDGTLIKLSPGNTWFQVVQPSVNITMK
jgi:hypothetical protein